MVLKVRILVHFLFNCESVSHSIMSDSATPWTVACQDPLSMGFSRQEYWSELPFPLSRGSSWTGIEPCSPALRADSLCLSHQGSMLGSWSSGRHLPSVQFSSCPSFAPTVLTGMICGLEGFVPYWCIILFHREERGRGAPLAHKTSSFF